MIENIVFPIILSVGAEGLFVNRVNNEILGHPSGLKCLHKRLMLIVFTSLG